jgi:hypothetical protein
MQFRKFIKLALATAMGITALQSMTAVAQEIRSEISVRGTGFFTKDIDGNGVQNHVTNTVGFLIAYRYSINRWLAAEANYGYDRNTQIYFSRGFGSLQSINRPIFSRAGTISSCVNCLSAREQIGPVNELLTKSTAKPS